MIQTSTKHKAALLAFSLALCLILLEILLRLGGAVLVMQRDKLNRNKLREMETVTILAVGESTTFMGGEASYPQLLEDILNTRFAEKSFTVINQGVPGIGTPYILDHIEEWIKQYRPDIVVAMMGVNDHNPYIPIDQYTKDRARLPFLQNLRIVKLGYWLSQNMTALLKAKARRPAQETPHIFPSLEKGQSEFDQAPAAYQKLFVAAYILENEQQYERAVPIIEKLLAWNQSPDLNRKLRLKLGNIYVKQKDFASLVNIVLDFLTDNPFDNTAAEWVHQICLDGQAAEQMLKHLQNLDSDDLRTVHFLNLASSCYAAMGQNELADEFARKYQGLRFQALNPVTGENYVRLARLLLDKDIVPVFVQYPMLDLKLLKQNFPPELTERLTFVNNADTFQQAVAEDGYDSVFSDRFNGIFGHCTPRGNTLLAGNVANVILEHVMTSNQLEAGTQ